MDQEHDRGEDKMIYVKHQGRLQRMTQRDLRPLTINDSDVCVVHGGKTMDPGAIGQLRTTATVHVEDKMAGGGKKKGPRKSSQSQSDQGAPDKSSSEADMFFELMEKSCKTGRTG